MWFRVRILIAIWLLATAGALQACERHKSPLPMVIEPSEADMGEVLQGQVLEHTFLLENTGSADLVVNGLEPGCHCTSARVANGTVKPGQKGAALVTVRTDRALGPFGAQVTVSTNDPNHSVVTLRMKALVKAEFSLSDQILDFSTSGLGARSRRLVIAAAPGTSSRILRVRSTEERVRARLASLGSGRYEVIATAAGESKALFGNLVVSTSSSLMPEITVPIRGLPGARTGRPQ